jgi:uncharacterized protein YdaU (DUF1376 family)
VFLKSEGNQRLNQHHPQNPQKNQCKFQKRRDLQEIVRNYFLEQGEEKMKKKMRKKRKKTKKKKKKKEMKEKKKKMKKK